LVGTLGGSAFLVRRLAVVVVGGCSLSRRDTDVSFVEVLEVFVVAFHGKFLVRVL